MLQNKTVKNIIQIGHKFLIIQTEYKQSEAPNLNKQMHHLMW